MIYLDVAKQIETLRKEMQEAIEKYGCDAIEVKNISSVLDRLIAEYYKSQKRYQEGSIMYVEYQIACQELKKWMKKLGKFPTLEAWNKYAKKNTFLNSLAIQYISGLEWTELEEKIKLDI